MSESKHSAEFAGGTRAKEAKKSKKAASNKAPSAVSLDPTVDSSRGLQIPQIPRLSIPEAKISTSWSERPSKSVTEAKNQLSAERLAVQDDKKSYISPQTDSVQKNSRTEVTTAQEPTQTARREAKKKRSKDKEKPISDNEAAKKELKSVMTPEDKLFREKRRQIQLDALNANAQECQEEDDYENEDFENYDDKLAYSLADDAHKTSLSTSRSVDKEVVPVIALRAIKRALEVESSELFSRTSAETNQSAATSTCDSKTSNFTRIDSDSSAIHSLEELKRSLDPRARRVRAILASVSLENETFYIFNQAPMKDYDRYINSLRRGKTRQAFAQCNDGAKAIAVQTKAPILKHQSMTFPDDIGTDIGSMSDRKEMLPGHLRHDNVNDEDSSATSLKTVGALFSKKFMDFIDQAAYTCELILDDDFIRHEQSSKDTNAGNVKSLGIEVPPTLFESTLYPQKYTSPLLQELKHILKDRELTWLKFSSGLTNYLVSCHGPQVCENLDASIQCKTRSIACVWDLASMEHPRYVLQCEDRIQIAVFGPFDKKPLIIAGTSDGSIHLWDLRESATCSIQENMYTNTITPTHSTCGSWSAYHSSTIIDIQNVKSQVSESPTQNNCSCQIGTLDDRGILILWSLVRIQDANTAKGYLDLVMNQKINTVDIYKHVIPRQRKTTNGTSRSTRDNSWTGQSCDEIGPIASVLRFLPSDCSQFLLGTTTGRILHGNRYKLQQDSYNQHQKQCVTYLRKTIGSRSIGVETVQLPACMCIEFNPFLENYFLAGYKDGVISIFRVGNSTSLCLWDGLSSDLSAVCSLEWSLHRPSVFLCSLACGTILLWDLLLSTHAAVVCQEVTGEKSVVSNTDGFFRITLSRRMTNSARIAIAYPTREADPDSCYLEVRELHSSLSRCAHSREIDFLKQTLETFV